MRITNISAQSKIHGSLLAMNSQGSTAVAHNKNEQAILARGFTQHRNVPPLVRFLVQEIRSGLARPMFSREETDSMIAAEILEPQGLVAGQLRSEPETLLRLIGEAAQNVSDAAYQRANAFEVTGKLAACEETGQKQLAILESWFIHHYPEFKESTRFNVTLYRVHK